MNVMEAIEQRRSVRSYRPDPIPEEVLDRLLSALRLAPSASNRQPWKFVVVRDAATKSRLARACTFVTPTGEVRVRPWIAGAPVVIAGCTSEQTPVNLAIALEHLALAAAAEGLGTCWIGGLTESQVKQVLGVPDDWRAPLVMPVGYPTEWPEPKERKPLEEIVCHDRFS